MTLSRRIVAECLGNAFLLAAVVGSGIMGEKLAGGNIAIALLDNTLATGAMLITLIFTFGPISGAHFNPAVTLADASQGGIGWSDVPPYLAAQVLGAFIGVAASHLMFGEALLQSSHHIRAGGGQLFSEFIATFGLLFLASCDLHRRVKLCTKIPYRFLKAGKLRTLPCIRVPIPGPTESSFESVESDKFQIDLRICTPF
jgi:glycerol uptake facilitator-like aquaporin